MTQEIKLSLHIHMMILTQTGRGNIDIQICIFTPSLIVYQSQELNLKFIFAIRL